MDDFLTALGAICFFISVYVALAYRPKRIDIRAGASPEFRQWTGRSPATPAGTEFTSAACHSRGSRRDSHRHSIRCERTSSGRIRSSRR